MGGMAPVRFRILLEAVASLGGMALIWANSDWRVALGVFLFVFGNNLMIGSRLKELGVIKRESY
jgi:hypothetical protein